MLPITTSTITIGSSLSLVNLTFHHKTLIITLINAILLLTRKCAHPSYDYLEPTLDYHQDGLHNSLHHHANHLAKSPRLIHVPGRIKHTAGV